MVVRALVLLIPGEDLVFKLRFGGWKTRAGAERAREAGQLLIETRQHLDCDARCLHGVNGRLQVAESLHLALPEERLVLRFQRWIKRRDARGEVGRIGFADKQGGPSRAVSRHVASSVGHDRRALLMSVRHATH